MNNKNKKNTANYFLYECGLLEELKKYGTPHIIGSYRMDLMAWNDLDIDIENDNMSSEKLYDLTSYITNTFRPTWYEAKEETTSDGKTIWFHGFETMISGELWNFDLWFFDRQTIEDAEKYCDDISSKIGESRQFKEAIIQIKEALISMNLYSFEQYKSTDVYKAVLEQNILNIDEFMQNYKK